MIPNSLLKLIQPLKGKFPRADSIYRNIRDQLDMFAEPVVTPWKFKLGGNQEMASGLFEPIETKLIREFVQEVDVFLNIGANIGYYCCHALSLGKSVIAFEPIQRNLQYLCKNISANAWTGAEIFPIALSNKVKILEIYGGNTGASLIKGWAGISENYVTLVPSSTLDIVIGNRLEGKKVLALIDVEGAEKFMLEGASILLNSSPKPIWIVEINSTQHQPEGVQINPTLIDTFEIFFEHGYQSYACNENMEPITMDEVKLVFKGEKTFSTHNFIFTQNESPNRHRNNA